MLLCKLKSQAGFSRLMLLAFWEVTEVQAMDRVHEMTIANPQNLKTMGENFRGISIPGKIVVPALFI